MTHSESSSIIDVAAGDLDGLSDLLFQMLLRSARGGLITEQELDNAVEILGRVESSLHSLAFYVELTKSIADHAHTKADALNARIEALERSAP